MKEFMDFVPTRIDLVILFLFIALFLVAGWLTTSLVTALTGKRYHDWGSNGGKESKTREPSAGPSSNSATRFMLLEYFLLIPLTAAVVVSLLLLATAQLGVFRFRVWLLLLFLYDAILTFSFRSKLRLWVRLPFSKELRGSWSDLLILPFLFLAVSLFHPVSEFVTTQRDPGEYVNIGVKLAETGSLRFVEPGFRQMNTLEKEKLFLPVSLDRAPYPEVIPGFYLIDPAQGLVLPQYFHLFPLWLALAFKLWRFAGLLSLNLCFGILSAVALVVLGERLFKSRAAGWMAGFLLIVNPAQIWIVRSPFSEILTQLFLLSGLWALTVAIREEHRGASLLAGLLLGLTWFVRLDSILVIVPLIGLALWMMTDSGKTAMPFSQKTFLCGLAGLTIYGGLHATVFAFPYFINVLDSFSLPPLRAVNLKSLGLIFALIIILGVGFISWKRLWGEWRKDWPQEKQGRVLFYGTALLISLLLAYAAFVRPGLNSARELLPLPPPHTGNIWLLNEISLLRLGWYVTNLGTVLAYLGSLVILYRLFNKRHFELLPFVLLLGVVTSFYLYKSRAFPDNYWVIRRYVPLVIPGFLCLAGGVLASSANWRGSIVVRFLNVYSPSQWTRLALSMGLFCIVFFAPLRTMSPFLQEPELKGAFRQVEYLATITLSADVILFEYGKAQDYFLGPLWTIFHKEVYPLVSQSPDVRCFDRLIQQWEKEGKCVYTISSEEHTRLMSQNYDFHPLERMDFQVRLAEAPYERIPQRMEELRLPLQVYRVTPKKNHGSPHAIPVNIGFQFGVMTSGLYQTELTDSQETYRWTGGEALVELPEIAALSDALLVLRLGRDFPESYGQVRARILFNNALIAEEECKGRLHVVKYRIPRSLLNREGSNQVRFLTPTVVPSNIAGTDDRRELGLMLDSLILLPLTPLSEAESYRIDLASELGDVEADLSGFCLRHNDPYRWSAPVARLVLPLPLPAQAGSTVAVRAAKSCPDPHVHQFLTVSVDGVDLGRTELLGAGKEFKVYSFKTPKSAPRSANPVIELKVDPPWTSDAAGKVVDFETLGCAVQWVQINASGKLIASAEKH
jgi:hypothetical protein